MKLNEHDLRNIKVDLNMYVLELIARSLSQYCGIRSHWSRRKPFISPINKKRRLKWAIEHHNWLIDEWRNVVWTDESPFVLRYQRPKCVLHLKSERYKEIFMMVL